MKYIKSTKEELNVSNMNLTKVVRKGTIVRKEFMKLVDNKIGISWMKLKEKNQEKVNWNVHKNEIEVKKGTFKGILVGDKELEVLEKESKNEMGGKAVVYGGIEVDKSEEDILNLPPDFAIFPKVDIEEFETDMEKCLIKCSWEVKNVQRKSESEKTSK